MINLRTIAILIITTLIVLNISASQESKADNKNVFKFYPRQDIVGHDYRNPFNDKSLLNTGTSGCRDACKNDQKCKAYTYNFQAGWCWLKTGHDKLKSFNGAISGVKINEDGDFRVTTSDKERITKTDYKFQTKGPAAPGSCTEELAAIKQLQQSLKLEIAKKNIAVGEELEIKWSQGALPHKRIPVYLMISSKSPVRFRGKGFYALSPNAKAAFDIATFKDTTRAIVPLYGKGVPEAGTVNILPVIAEPLELNWSVVGYTRKCGNTHASENTPININVRAGTPRIVIDDPFSLVRPKLRYISPDKSRILEIYQDFFRLKDSENGNIITHHQGKEPRFSPTGRFFTAASVEIEGLNHFYDSISGEQLGETEASAWENNDSFVFEDYKTQGIISITTPLIENGEKYLSGGMSCNACVAWDDASAKIDLENNVLVVAPIKGGSFAKNIYLKSLTTDQILIRDDWKNKSQNPKRDALKFIERVSQTTRFKFPQHWDLEGGIKTTNPIEARTAKQLNKIFVKPVKFKGTRLAVAKRKHTDKTTRNLNWRNVAKKNTTSNNKPIVSRLKELGFTFKKTSIVEQNWLRDAGLSDKQKKIYNRLRGKKAQKYWNDYQARIKSKAKAKKAELLAHDEKLAPILFVRNPKHDQYNSEICISDVDEKYGLNDLTEIVSFNSNNNQHHLLQFECGGGGGIYAPGPSGFTVLASKNLPNGFQEIPLPLSFKPIRTIDGRYLFTWANDRVYLFDIEKLKMVLEFAPEEITENGETKMVNSKIINSELTEQFLLTNDLQHIMQINKDGKFYVHHIRSKERVLEGRYEDDELIVWTPDGHFDATAEGVHFARLAFAGRTGHYTFAQFDKRLRVPDLAQKILNGETITGPGWSTVGVPPELLANLKKSDIGTIIGSAKAKTDHPLKSINIYQDGILTNQLEPGKDGVIAIDVARLKGARWLSAVAVDQEGLVSQPIGVDLGVDETGKTKLHYLTVGIDKYETANDLSFAVSDAENLAQSLKTISGKSIELGIHETLTDKGANAEAILANIKTIVEQAKQGDTIVFSFAGHGVRDKEGKYYLGTSSINPADIPGTGLLWQDVVKIFAGSKARIAVFLDACHSGAAGTDNSIYATNDQVVSGLLSGMPPGLVVFSASKGRELSEEDGVRGGIFTNAVTDVINFKRDQYDSNKNGAIEISELYYGVKRQVVKNAQRQQTPWLARNQMVGDFSLF